MRHRVIRLLQKTDYDFSGLVAGTSVVNLPLAQNISLADWGTGALMVRVHAVNLQTGSSFRVDARTVAPTSEAPGNFFRGPIIATVAAQQGLVTAPALLRTRLASQAGAAMSLFLSVFQEKVGPLTFTISIDLLLQERADGWTPAELGTKLRLWLDQRDLVAVSGAYSDWGDQSLAAQDFTQGTSTLRPLTGSAINSWPAPEFDGTNDYFGRSALSNFVSATAYHVFAVVRAQTVTGTNATAYLNNGIVGDFGIGWWGLYLKTNGSNREVHGFHWDSNLRDAIASGLKLDEDALIEWSYDGTTLRCQVGGGPVATAVGGGAIGSLADPVRVGTGANGGLYLDGAIASILVCDAYLSGGEARSARDYLSSKYGVPG
jgi:hypothetical protein